MATPFTVYKLIVLYMLQNTENTLTNSQISEFILDREYTNYFHLQQAISELVEAELITMDTRSNVSHYRITEDGIKTLSFFQKDLSPEIKQEVREYLKSTGFKAQERLLHHQTGNLFCKMPAHRKGQLPHRPEHRSS